jgi:hypothetical protein
MNAKKGGVIFLFVFLFVFYPTWASDAGSDVLISKYIKQLKKSNPELRGDAALALGNMGADSKNAVPALAQALSDNDSLVRDFSATALGKIGPSAKSAIPALVTALNDPDPIVRASASEALSRIRQDAGNGIPEVHTALSDTNELKVAVFDFVGLGDAVGIGREVAQNLRATLKETREYVVVDRNIIKSALNKQQRTSPGAIDKTTALRVGEAVGAKYVAVGSVSAGPEIPYTLKILFLDVKTGTAVFGKKLTSETKEGIPALCAQFSLLLSRNLATGRKEAAYPVEEPTIQSTRKDPTEVLKKNAFKESWALGLVYPGGTLRYKTSGASAWELKAQSGSGVLAVGARYYCYFTDSSGPYMFLGAEADYLTFKGVAGNGNGFAGGAFAGWEIPITKQTSLLMDFGPMYISLTDSKYSESASGIGYIMNMGIYLHF